MSIKLSGKTIIALVLILFCVLMIGYELSGDIFVSGTVESEGQVVVLPIVMYHEVKTFKTGKDVITPAEFENDLKFLVENQYNTITMTELIDYVYHDAPLPDNPIILSFDDGYLNNYVYVMPLLKKYNMKIVFSLLGKNSDDFTRIPDNNLDYSHVTWEQLKEMHDTGLVDIQNHTYNLHKITKSRIGCMQKKGESITEYEKVLSDDVNELQDKIYQTIGKTPNTFAYPYGKLSKNTDEIIKKLGFKASLSCKYGINIITKNPENLFGLKRINRSHGQSVNKTLKEAMKTLKYVKFD